MFFRTVGTTQLGIDVSAAKKVTMETQLSGRAERAHAHSPLAQRSELKKKSKPKLLCYNCTYNLVTKINLLVGLQFCGRLQRGVWKHRVYMQNRLRW